MDPFSTAPDFILDSIFLKLNEEDLHETLRVSKSWFWASVRRTKKLKIAWEENPLKSMAQFYNNHRPPNEKLDWQDLFKHLVLDELIVIRNKETANYLVNNGCNTAELTIEDSGRGEVPVTLASLRTIARLESLEFRQIRGAKWHPFIIECLKSSKCEFDPNTECPIEAVKLNSSGCNAEDPVLHSVTELTVWCVTIDFLRALLDLCPNLEEIRCSYGQVTQKWHHVFPAKVKRIEFHDVDVDDDVATVVNVSADAGRQLLPYLCQDWRSVEKFHFDGYINVSGQTIYEAFPQQREEVFVCQEFDKEMNLASPHFQSRKIHVICHAFEVLELIIPSTKSVKLEFIGEYDFKCSPRDVCLEPGKVERFALFKSDEDEVFSALQSKILPKEFTVDPFGPTSFEGFTRLTCLTLSHVSALSIKMALDQCPSIKKLKLKYLKKFTFGRVLRGSSHANVCELVLEDCKESMSQVFQVFPRLSKFKQSKWRKDEICKAGNWLWRHLIEEDKKYGVSFENSFEIWYLVSDDLQASLSKTQKLLNGYIHTESMSYLKGFKLLPRVSKQKIVYLN